MRVWILFSCPLEGLSSENVGLSLRMPLIYSLVYGNRIRGFVKPDSEVGKSEYERKAADIYNPHSAKQRLAVYIKCRYFSPSLDSFHNHFLPVQTYLALLSEHSYSDRQLSQQ
jgi:hypothetical protein